MTKAQALTIARKALEDAKADYFVETKGFNAERTKALEIIKAMEVLEGAQ